MDERLLSYQPLTIVWRHKVVAASVFIVVFGIFILYALFGAKVYEATTWLLVDRSRAGQALTQGAGSDEAKRTLLLTSLVRIAQSEDVLRSAMRNVDIDALFPNVASTNKLTSDEAYLRVKGNVVVDVEPNTDLFRISFRNSDPRLAAEFANNVAASFQERHSKINSNPQAVEFFRSEEQRYNAALEEASQKLADYTQASSIFSAPEQKTLLLARRDKASSDLANTLGQIGKLESELVSLRSQLSALRGTINLPPEIFGSTTPNIRTRETGASNDPSLLHLRLYQESTQILVKTNAELAGLRGLEKLQETELKNIVGELQALSVKESEFAKLTRMVAQASAQIELLGKRAAEAQFDNAWRSNDNLSAIQVVQAATAPLRPSEPKVAIVMLIGLVAGAFLGACAALLADLNPRAVPRWANKKLRTTPRWYARAHSS